MELSSGIAAYIDASRAEDASRGLIDAASLSSIRRTASTLPSLLTEFFGFECPLWTPQGTADFLVCVGAAEGGRAVLSGDKPGWDYARFEHQPVWKRVREFAALWSNPRLPLFDAVSGVWLEFDSGQQWQTVPSPSLFFGSETLRPGLSTDWLTTCALPVLNTGPLDREQSDAILRCLQALPQGARIFQVGMMLSRHPCLTRLCVRGLSPDQIGPYLNQVGWPGDLTDLQETVKTLASRAQRIDLDLDLAGSVRPKLGLETYYDLGAGVEKLISFLERQGYCVPEKAIGLRNWQGLTLETVHDERWPRELTLASAFLGGRLKSSFVRWLHHVKFVFEPGCQLRAKAYLGVRHAWLTPDMLQSIVQAVRQSDTEATCVH